MVTAVAAFFFFLEKKSGWKFFKIFPPLLFIYATPILLTNTGIIPSTSPVYGAIKQFALPAFIVLMLLGIDVAAAIRVMGKGILVMLIGTLGIVVGGVVAYSVVHHWLDPLAWKGFGALAGSWIGGTGNMAATAGALELEEGSSLFSLVLIADNLVYVVWLPILLGSKSLADRFNRWARVPEDRIKKMDAAAAAVKFDEKKPGMTDYLYLATIALSGVWLAAAIAPMLPEFQPVLSTSSWKILLVTTFGIVLSLTPARKVPGSHDLAMAIVYIFVARMGAQAVLKDLDQAPAFLVGAFLWIFIHGLFCLAGAWLLRVDVHSVAIASAANVGGAASAPIVAAYHRESLVPASILMALIGYAMGNYLSLLVAQLCHWVGG